MIEFLACLRHLFAALLNLAMVLALNLWSPPTFQTKDEKGKPLGPPYTPSRLTTLWYFVAFARGKLR